jgi:hypothetical protein
LTFIRNENISLPSNVVPGPGLNLLSICTISLRLRHPVHSVDDWLRISAKFKEVWSFGSPPPARLLVLVIMHKWKFVFVIYFLFVYDVFMLLSLYFYFFIDILIYYPYVFIMFACLYPPNILNIHR